MPWCPNCKNEYRQGIFTCADCGCTLVEEEPIDNQVSLIFGEEEQMSSLKEFLEFNKIQGVVMRFDQQEKVYELLVQEKDKKTASNITRIFLEQETQKEETQEDNAQADGDVKESYLKADNAVYRKNADKAEDNKSSGWTLLVTGAAGMVFMVFGIAGVLPLKIGNPYMFYGVMSAVFLLFIVMGAVSMRNAKVFEKKAESENTLRDTMEKWCAENLDAAKIDRELFVNAGDPEEDAPEILYYKRYEKLKELLNRQFMNLDQAFLENFIDEIVYDMIFGA